MDAWLSDVVRFPVPEEQASGSADTDSERYAIENVWRMNLDAAFQRYNAASEIYRKLLNAGTQTGRTLADDPLEKAQKIRNQAHAEYSRLLRVFADLTIYGKKPEENA